MRQPEYLNKQLAAKRSGLSVRRLLELAQNGRIRRHHFRDPKTNRHIAVFDAEDIDKLRIGNLPVQANRQISASGAAMPQPGTYLRPSAEPPWLTLEQAEAYIGLPAKWILWEVNAGRLAALDVGIRLGGRWRVHKRDLDAITATTQLQAKNSAEI